MLGISDIKRKGSMQRQAQKTFYGRRQTVNSSIQGFDK